MADRLLSGVRGRRHWPQRYLRAWRVETRPFAVACREGSQLIGSPVEGTRSPPVYPARGPARSGPGRVRRGSFEDAFDARRLASPTRRLARPFAFHLLSTVRTLLGQPKSLTAQRLPRAERYNAPTELAGHRTPRLGRILRVLPRARRSTAVPSAPSRRMSLPRRRSHLATARERVGVQRCCGRGGTRRGPGGGRAERVGAWGGDAVLRLLLLL